jgi:hypothetical protein
MVAKARGRGCKCAVCTYLGTSAAAAGSDSSAGEHQGQDCWVVERGMAAPVSTCPQPPEGEEGGGGC